MLRRINFYSICFAFGLSVLLILAGSRYTDNTNYRPSTESRRNIRNFLKIEDGEEDIYQPIPTNPYDGSPNIEKILEKTRAKIKIELWHYNYSYSGVHQLEDLLMESGGQPLRSVIFSTWRSGTTFLGEVLNAMPGNFYHYEPLLKYEIIQIRGSPHAEKALSTIKNMLKCNYDNMEDYFEYGKSHLHQFSHNTRLWDHCKYKKELCFDADFTAKFCKLFPFQSMKVVRVRLKLVQELLDDKECDSVRGSAPFFLKRCPNSRTKTLASVPQTPLTSTEKGTKRLRMKVVLLIRDPRGVLQSRQHRNFCQPAPDCWRPELLCADMISDYVAAARLLQQYPDKLMVLRYEELALNPNTTTHELLKFLGLSAMPTIDEFLHTHTNADAGGVSSTFRVSRDVPFRWKNILDFDYVKEIQRECKEAMKLWGYRMAHNATHMAGKDFNPLQEYSIKL